MVVPTSVDSSDSILDTSESAPSPLPLKVELPITFSLAGLALVSIVGAAWPVDDDAVHTSGTVRAERYVNNYVSGFPPQDQSVRKALVEFTAADGRRVSFWADDDTPVDHSVRVRYRPNYPQGASIGSSTPGWYKRGISGALGLVFAGATGLRFRGLAKRLGRRKPPG
ncbi:DUF3592 domain-containing protein [Actinomadura terrae]|uniref:DUF3592 domain-containing protein n=1 Tax=Actinomadura terrae TaxID=604353 RepID=UPI001FA7D5A9|nr:DUF3592 domain-containing protein [Actinomadura terrae]